MQIEFQPEKNTFLFPKGIKKAKSTTTFEYGVGFTQPTLNAIRKYFFAQGKTFTAYKDAAGLHYIGWIADEVLDGVDSITFIKDIAENGIIGAMKKANRESVFVELPIVHAGYNLQLGIVITNVGGRTATYLCAINYDEFLSWDYSRVLIDQQKLPMQVYDEAKHKHFLECPQQMNPTDKKLVENKELLKATLIPRFVWDKVGNDSKIIL